MVEVKGYVIVTAVLLVFEEDVLRLICGYAPHSGRSLEEKQSFYDEQKCKWDMHSADDLVTCFGDCSGHIVKHTDGFDGVHGVHSVGQMNFEKFDQNFS